VSGKEEESMWNRKLRESESKDGKRARWLQSVKCKVNCVFGLT